MDYQVTQIAEVEHSESEYALVRFSGKQPMTGVPGQFVMVRGDWGTDPILPRAFSLVEVGETAAILVRAVGKGTHKLKNMHSGDTLGVLGPAGNGFSVPAAGSRPVLVAGGVGVAPLIFLAEQLAAEGARPIFVYGARSVQDLPLLARTQCVGDFYATTEDGSFGEKGMATEPLKRILETGENIQLFSCGPEPMLKAVALLAGSAGVPCEIALESPMACGMGTCKGCAVPGADGEYRYVCCDGPVFNSAEIYGGAK
jgi:dihydroorotate dehydrogenase electron transfer subunit